MSALRNASTPRKRASVRIMIPDSPGTGLDSSDAQITPIDADAPTPSLRPVEAGSGVGKAHGSDMEGGGDDDEVCGCSVARMSSQTGHACGWLRRCLRQDHETDPASTFLSFFLNPIARLPKGHTHRGVDGSPWVGRHVYGPRDGRRDALARPCRLAHLAQDRRLPPGT